MKSVKQIRLWSNAFFLIPAFLAFAYHIYWYSLIISLVFTISSYFHFSKEKKLEYVDITSSSLLMISNFTLLIQGHWMLPFSILALSCAAIALGFYYRQFKKGYNLNHGIWHIFSAATSYFCVMTLLRFSGLL